MYRIYGTNSGMHYLSVCTHLLFPQLLGRFRLNLVFVADAHKQITDRFNFRPLSMRAQYWTLCVAHRHVRPYKPRDVVLLWTYLCLHQMDRRSNRVRMIVKVETHYVDSIHIILSP